MNAHSLIMGNIFTLKAVEIIRTRNEITHVQKYPFTLYRRREREGVGQIFKIYKERKSSEFRP